MFRKVLSMYSLTLEQPFQFAETCFQSQRSFSSWIWTIFTVKRHLWLNGQGGKQNFPIWTETNPNPYLEALKPKRAIYCIPQTWLLLNHIYFEMRFWIPNMQDLNIDYLWAQKDDVRAKQPTKLWICWEENFSTKLFPEMVLLWEFFKSMDYVNKPKTLEASEVNIRRTINEIRSDTEKVTRNWNDRKLFELLTTLNFQLSAHVFC